VGLLDAAAVAQKAGSQDEFPRLVGSWHPIPERKRGKLLAAVRKEGLVAITNPPAFNLARAYPITGIAAARGR
jgi:hypothetical protein